MTHLHLSSNQIVNISRYAFAGLTKLQYLSLERNRIQISKLDPLVFVPLTKLYELKIHTNNLTGEVSYNDNLFSPLVNLNFLEMDAISDVVFGASFSRLRSLKSMILYGTINHIYNDTFVAFHGTPLTNLSIISGTVAQVDVMAFAELNNLVGLRLNYNEQLSLNVSKAWPGLKSTKLRMLFLERINSATYISLRNDFFAGLEEILLQILLLDDNQITSLEPGFHRYMPCLKRIYLRKNHLSTPFVLMCDACFIDTLMLIDMDSQYRASIDHGISANLEFDQVSGVDFSEVCLQDRGESNNSKICRETCQNLTQDSNAVHLVLPLKLQYLLMATALSVAGNSMPAIYVHGRNALRRVDLSDNAFQNINGSLNVPGDILTDVELDLGYNQCFNLNPNFFRYSKNIVNLNLQNNGLGDQLGREGDRSFLKYLQLLMELNLANNNIKNIPKYTFSAQINLQILNLTGNSFLYITFEMSHMKNLTYLDLSRNLLTQLTYDVYNIFTPNMHLSLLGNPLSCSCDSLDFLEWMDEMKNIFLSWGNYTCTYRGKWTSLKLLKSTIVHYLSIDCSSNTLLVISAVTLFAMSLILCISICFYRHRFEVKYACIRLIWQRKKYDKLIRKDNLMYKYDAFVAYHKDDIWFVKDHLINNLETKEHTDPPLKLCIHERDFMPGGVIEENIIDAIESSRKTILVLSKGFLMSYWCDFEYHMARMRCLERGDDTIIVIILEELPVRYISKPLFAWLKRSTYLEWPENSLEIPHFWEKLKESIE